LARIEQLIPYKAEIFPVYGEDFKLRIQQQLSQCHFMIVLLTENGKNSQWVNQEIGFVQSLIFRRRNKTKPYIIPITHKKVKLKGFLTKDTIDFLFLDNYPTFENVIADLINYIRYKIPKGEQEGTLTYQLTCFNCHNKKGLQFHFYALLPTPEQIAEAFRINKFYLPYKCPNCKTTVFVDIRTLESESKSKIG
jgi:hypothetical protein